jgi:hypothetical protein
MMWKLGLWPPNSFSGNICFEYSVLCFCSVFCFSVFCSLVQHLHVEGLTSFSEEHHCSAPVGSMGDWKRPSSYRRKANIEQRIIEKRCFLGPTRGVVGYTRPLHLSARSGIYEDPTQASILPLPPRPHPPCLCIVPPFT